VAENKFWPSVNRIDDVHGDRNLFCGLRPEVPACYGWLSLDRRGRWRLRGETVTHAGLKAFSRPPVRP
jgi:hypothetical protein